MHAYNHYAVRVMRTTCPSCLKQAEIVDQFVLASTDGPAAHVRVRCEDAHVYTLLVDDSPSSN
jgi:hypothetical protein